MRTNNHTRRHLTSTLAMMGAALSVSAAASSTCLATDFVTTKVASGLEAPMGITNAGMYPYVCVTEVPTPGINGDNGGRNRVIAINLADGGITELNAGEPYPVNLARASQHLFWTCKSAGVILHRLPDGTVEHLLDNLNAPSGIFTDGDMLYFTEVPFPGEKNPANRVLSFDGTTMTELVAGEPAPTDITMGSDGSLYWTCKTAGVIVRYDTAGHLTTVLEDLNSPTGIASDEMGHIYFTEVPTPGVNGDEGGFNKIWRYTIDSGMLDLVNEGDPEPTDVTVSPTGSFIAWTCTSAGVIKVARPL
ncbi:MAG: hypothetical protein D8M59_01075 [Planctomycetes bacterium]|nr:hypothetical protein [Planctomycetota bacterium]NOG54686.1 hypothetical protein [Planctomycetota bacterium]